MRLSLALFPAVCVAAVARALLAPVPPQAPRADEAAKQKIYADLRGREREKRLQAAQDFPTDPWSRDDAFHAFEADRVEELARKQRVPITDVLAALDDGMRNQHDRATMTPFVPPCHPRAIY